MSRRSSAVPIQRKELDHAHGRDDMEKLLSVEEEVADYLGVPVNTLYQWRHKGTAPIAFRVGRFLRYDPAQVRYWLFDHAEVSHGAR